MCDTFNALVRSLVMWDHTVLPATRQRWFSRLYPQHIAGTHLSTPEGWKAELTWVTVTHPSINRARRRVTPLIKTNVLPLSQATSPGWVNNCGSESSTLETDVCVWRYTPVVVLATQEEEEDEEAQVIWWEGWMCCASQVTGWKV